MTAHKHFKQLVRERMTKTGESYTTARRQLTGSHPPADPDPRIAFHFPGSVPGSTVARVLLSDAGVKNPHTGEPLSEAMTFGISGGIGIGTFQFFYEKDDFASFFIAGRHLWQDDQEYLQNLCGLLGASYEVRETGGAKAAEQQLREELERGPVAMWVDSASLPHRAAPDWMQGGGYHIVTAYDVAADGTVRIGDLSDEPIAISMKDLAKARERIKKQKNRLLAIRQAPESLDPHSAVYGGLKACVQSLTEPGWKGYRTNFSLDSLKQWAERMRGNKSPESWDRVFPRGKRLWSGLTSISEYIEFYGTGGGLCRPLFAEFLSEAGTALKDERLLSLSQRYAEIGAKWSELANAALPDDIPMFHQAREVQMRRSRTRLEGEPSEVVRSQWEKLGALSAEAAKEFPLSDAECLALRAQLADRVMELHALEKEALEGMKKVVE